MSWPHVDWGKAPEDAVAWVFMDNEGWWVTCFWIGRGKQWFTDTELAPDFGYTGHPRDSLTLRPQETTP